MTFPHNNKPLFLYSYDPPSPRRLSEYDPPYPEEVLSPYNEKNYLKYELNQSYFYEEEQSQASVNKELETTVTTSSVCHSNELKSIDVSPSAHRDSQNSINAKKINEMNLVPTTLTSEFSSQSTSEEFYNSYSESSTKKKPQDKAEVQSNDCNQMDISGSYASRDEVASFSELNNSPEYSRSSSFNNTDESNGIGGEKLSHLESNIPTSISSLNIEKSPISGTENESSVPLADTTTSDVAKCSSPLSTTHSVSSLPSDTFTINVPCDWSTSDRDLQSLDFDNNIPNILSGVANSLSNFVNNSAFSTRDNLTASFTASIDSSIDSALASSPPFSPALTESCTITPLPNDCTTPNSTNPTSTPLPSPIPSDLLFAATSESSPSTPSTVTTSDLLGVSKMLEQLAENVVNNDFETNNDLNNKFVSKHSPQCINGLTDNAESAAMSAKKSIVAQLSSIFESRNIQSSLSGVGAENFDCDKLQIGNVKEFMNKTNSEWKNFRKQKLNSSILPNTEENLIESNKEMSLDERTKVNNEVISNEIECKIKVDECSFPRKYPPAPPSRLTSSCVLPPPLPPPPVEDWCDETPPVPELPLSIRFNFYHSNSSNEAPVPPVRQYLLIPLTPGRKTPILFNPPCIPIRSVSLSRTPKSPKMMAQNFERSSQDNAILFEREDLLHETEENEHTFKEIMQCTKKENGFIQSLTPVPEERSSPLTTSPSPSKVTDGEITSSQIANEIRPLNGCFDLNNEVKFKCDRNLLVTDDPPPLPSSPEDPPNCCPPPIPPKPCPLKLSAAFSSPPPTPPPPPPKRSKSLSSTPLPIIIFSAPDPFSENSLAGPNTTVMENPIKSCLLNSDSEQICPSSPSLELPVHPTPPSELSSLPASLSELSSPPVHLTEVPSMPVHTSGLSSPPAHRSKIPSPPAHPSGLPSPPARRSKMPSPPAHRSKMPSPPAHPSGLPSPPAHPSELPSPKVHSSALPIPPVPPITPGNKTSLTSVSPYGKFVVNRTDLPLLCPEEEVRKVMANAKSYGWINSEEDTLAIYSQVRPIIQQGPQCGLVALSMASQLCSSTVPVEKLLKIAREMGYSTHGEMFSAQYMKALANEAIRDTQATVRTDIFDSAEFLVKTLMDGDFILVPYDADRNHQPGFSHGKKAHWGLICGCLLQSPSMVLKQELTTAKLDVQMDNLWHFRPIQIPKSLPEDRPSSVTPAHPQRLQEGRQRNARSVSPNIFPKDLSLVSPLNGDSWSKNISNLILLWRQGKSRNLIMAPFEDIRRSNQQLNEYLDLKDYVIDDIGTDLSGQVVVLHKVKQSLSDLLGALQRDLKF